MLFYLPRASTSKEGKTGTGQKAKKAIADRGGEEERRG